MADRAQVAKSEDVQAADRRVVRRKGLQLQADVTLPGSSTIVAHALDLSPGGISVAVPYMLEFRQECIVELDLSALGGPIWAQLTAEVRHCADAEAGCFRAGLQFINLDPLIAELLDGLL